MDRGAPAPESSSPPSPSPTPTPTPTPTPPSDNPPAAPAPPEPSSSSKQQQQHKPQQQQHPSRYESQKRRDWNTFLQYLKNHKPPLTLARCSGAHVIEFLKYLDQFGKTKVHNHGCPYFGHPNPPAPCTCPLKQAWGSLDALIGRLRAAYEENGGKPESNPFGARAVRIYLREVRESQAKARGIPYEKKKKRKRTTTGASGAATGEEESSSSSASKVAATTTSEGGKNGDGKGEGSGVGTTDKKLTETATATVNRDSSPTPRAS